MNFRKKNPVDNISKRSVDWISSLQQSVRSFENHKDDVDAFDEAMKLCDNCSHIWLSFQDQFTSKLEDSELKCLGSELIEEFCRATELLSDWDYDGDDPVKKIQAKGIRENVQDRSKMLKATVEDGPETLPQLVQELLNS